MKDLVAELKELKDSGHLFADDESTGLEEPATFEQMHLAESKLGFSILTLIKAIYIEIANGGFGYSYGLLGIGGGATNEDGNSADDLYRLFREENPDDPHWSWPEKLLPLNHLGCAMYLCVDCSNESLPVVWFEPNPHQDGESWDESFIPFSNSFEQMMRRWLSGADLIGDFSGDT